MKKTILIVLLVLFIDQFIKIYIKTHFYLGEDYHVFGNWFIIHFTENNGMAYGYELNGQYGKILLSVFRIVAVGGIAWYLRSIVNKNAHWIVTTSLSLILAGAIGNILDSAFYGILFSESNYEIAEFLPSGGGYASFLYGKVVDMFYFPIIQTHFPDWFPLWGNQEFIFFSPIFNFADASITIGVLLLLISQSKYFSKAPDTTVIGE